MSVYIRKFIRRNQNRKDEIFDILNSTKGSQRAKPSEGLFVKIQREIREADTFIIPLPRLKWAVAAAILLLVINGLVVQQNYKTHKIDAIAEPAEDESIISNYTLYDQ